MHNDETQPGIEGDVTSLPNEVDQALEALWSGDSGKLDHLLGTAAGEKDAESTIARMVRAAARFNEKAETPAPPDRIDDFAIEGEIGRGGMGVVYRARQAHPDRTVAIKLIRPGKLTAEHRRRFRYEADVLASLSHPGIATIHQAGIHEIDGNAQPYIVMELVDGRPLAAYVQQQQLPLRKRLDLFVQVCDAVRYAHQRGVIHRDLKPENMLVTADGVKLLDFGVARPLDADDDPNRPQTTDSSFVGTMLYMSPEQIDRETIDVRSDVYSLGVVLYELLIERSPYAIDSTRPAQVIQAIREQPPRFGRDVSLENDLKLIIQTAMAKDCDQRYASADALAMDVKRYLRNQPILARPPSAIYQLHKFVQRNALLTAVAAGLVLALCAAVLGTSVGMVQARAAGEEAARQAAIAEAVSEFLRDDLLGAIDPAVTMEYDVSMRALLDQASERIEGRFDDEPLVQASIRQTISQTYYALGNFVEAERHAARAVETFQREYGEEHQETLKARDHLAKLYTLLARYDESERLHRDVVETSRRINGPNHRDTLQFRGNLANLFTSTHRHDEAETILADVYETSRRVHGQRHPTTIGHMINLGNLYQEMARLDEAEAMLIEVVELANDVLGTNHPQTLSAKNNLAYTYDRQRQYELSEPIHASVLETYRRLLGDDHPGTLTSMNNLALVYNHQQRFDEAEPLFIESLEGMRRMYGEEHPDTITLINNLGFLYLNQQRIDESLPMLEEAVTLLRRVHGDATRDSTGAMHNLARVYLALENYELAEPLLANLVMATRMVAPEGHPAVGNVLQMHGHSLLMLNQHEQAEQALLESYAILEELLGDEHAQTKQTIQHLIDLYTAWHEIEPDVGHDADAASWRALLD